ncbi:hypothetical protein JHK85_043989 [Glycine max]|nr:hypothetical protein JHK85_043989 [Glycine max]
MRFFIVIHLFICSPEHKFKIITGSQHTGTVEFDTLVYVEFSDVNGNQVGLDLNRVVSKQVSDLGGIGVDLKSGDSMNTWIEYNGNANGLCISVSYSNVRRKDPILKVDLDVGMYVKNFMYVGFSRTTQGSTEVHSVEWCMAKEAARSTTVTRWSHDSGMGEGRGKQENVVVSWLGFVNI